MQEKHCWIPVPNSECQMVICCIFSSENKYFTGQIILVKVLTSFTVTKCLKEMTGLLMSVSKLFKSSVDNTWLFYIKISSVHSPKIKAFVCSWIFIVLKCRKRWFWQGNGVPSTCSLVKIHNSLSTIETNFYLQNVNPISCPMSTGNTLCYCNDVLFCHLI